MKKKEGKAFDFKVLKRTLKYVKPYNTLFFFIICASLILAITSVTRPYLIKYSIDTYIFNSDISGLLNITLIMVALLIAESILQFLFVYGANWIGQNIIQDIRKNLFKKIISFNISYFDRTPIGRLVTRLVSDIEAIAEIFSQGIIIMIGDIFKILLAVLLMFYINPFLAAITLSAFPFLLLSTIWFQRAMKLAFQQVRNEVAALNTFVQEHLVSMSIVQIFNREEMEYNKFKTINKRHLQANLNSIWYFSIFLPLVEMLSAIALGLVIWRGGIHSALYDSISFGDLIAFITLINMLFRPIRQTADRFNVLQMGIVASDRVFDVLDTSFHIQDKGILKPKRIIGNIEFKDVIFSYTDKEVVLKKISFNIKAGETIAIVGSTGSGKTTIANLILRFYELQEGIIKIDGVNYKEINLKFLRKNIALVQQDVFLFADSIFNNITLKSAVDKDLIIKASKEIGIDKFINKIKDKYEYNIGERGGKLSSGQRQLLAFLRAYIFNPSVLILDEATSSVDSYMEALIHKAIDKLTKNRTSIIIAHRLATVQKADKIIVLEKGKIVEEGRHLDLLKQDGVYKKLYLIQFSNS